MATAVSLLKDLGLFGAGEKTGGGAKGMMLDNPASMYNMILHYRYIYIYTYNIL